MHVSEAKIPSSWKREVTKGMRWGGGGGRERKCVCVCVNQINKIAHSFMTVLSVAVALDGVYIMAFMSCEVVHSLL